MGSSRVFIVCTVFTFLYICACATSKKYFAKLSRRQDMVKGARSPRDTVHEVIFSLKLLQLPLLESMVDDISDLSSPNYGKHLTRDEISSLTANAEAFASLTDYLVQNLPEAEITTQSRDNRFVYVRAPIHRWESMFACEFHVFSRKSSSSNKRVEVESSLEDVFDLEIHRAVSYELPKELHAHVANVFNTVQMPPRSRSTSRKSARRAVAAEDLVFEEALDQQQQQEGLEAGAETQEAQERAMAAPLLNPIQNGYVTPKLLNNLCTSLLFVLNDIRLFCVCCCSFISL